MFAIKDNRTNGLRLSHGDWKHCVSKVLLLSQGKKTPGAVAKELGCPRSTAYRIEKELSQTGQLPKVEKRRGADGKERSTTRKVKQPSKIDVKPFEPHVSKSHSIDSVEKIEGQDQQAPQGCGGIVPFDFETTTPVKVEENIKPPSSPGLDKEINDVLDNLTLIAQRHSHRRGDRIYIRKMVGTWFNKYCQEND